MFFSERILGTDCILAEWHRIEPFMGDPLLGSGAGELCRRHKGSLSGESSHAMPEALVRARYRWCALLIARSCGTDSLLRVRCRTEGIEDSGFVSDYPTVMSWRNVGNISWTELHFLAIVRFHMHPT